MQNLFFWELLCKMINKPYSKRNKSLWKPFFLVDIYQKQYLRYMFTQRPEETMILLLCNKTQFYYTLHFISQWRTIDCVLGGCSWAASSFFFLDSIHGTMWGHGGCQHFAQRPFTSSWHWLKKPRLPLTHHVISAHI